jgi:serine O-acetyltransferase
VQKDIQRTYDLLDGGRLSKALGCFRSPGVHAALIYRYGRWLKRQNITLRVLLEPIYLLSFHRIRSKWGIEIPRSAQIGEGLYVGHHGGIVISAAAVIGKNANISHQVTIGVSGQGDAEGTPILGDNVYIAPGAKIFGKIRIGNSAKIGANVVVHKDVPDNAVVVLDPGFKIVSFDGNHPTPESYRATGPGSRRKRATSPK